MRHFEKLRISFNVSIIWYFLTAFSVSGQTYPNLFQHSIDTPPSVFRSESSAPPDKIFRGRPNFDASLDGKEYKVRTYTPDNRFGNHLHVTCIYSLVDGSWMCERARFFQAYQPNGSGAGVFPPGSPVANLLVRTINFHPEGVNNRSEWQNIQGVQVTGKPLWIAASLSTGEAVVVARLALGNQTNPLQEVSDTINLFKKLVDDRFATKSSGSDLKSPSRPTLQGIYK
jgi:hypothetical protein